VLIGESRGAINTKIELLRQTRESKSFSFVRVTEYMYCNFNKKQENDSNVKIGENVC